MSSGSCCGPARRVWNPQNGAGGAIPGRIAEGISVSNVARTCGGLRFGRSLNPKRSLGDGGCEGLIGVEG